MKTYTLSPFKSFKCVSKKCKHNCCLGWQIDIDKRTLKKYRKAKGVFAEKLKSGVDFCNAKFKMQNGQCSFLNNDSLCEIIINFGEDALCQVCRDHPRYRNFFSTFTEYGVGLCCEEAARNLVYHSDKITTVFVRDDKHRKNYLNKKEKTFEQNKLLFRQKALDIIQNRNDSVKNRIISLLKLCGTDEKDFLNFNWKNEFLKLERLNDEWTSKLKGTRLLSLKFSQKNAVALEQITYYFIHRHVSAAIDEADLRARLLFCVLSVFVISSICASRTNDSDKYSLELLADVAREYSSEIEYSEDNTNALLDILDGFIKMRF